MSKQIRKKVLHKFHSYSLIEKGYTTQTVVKQLINGMRGGREVEEIKLLAHLVRQVPLSCTIKEFSVPSSGLMTR